MGFDVAWRTRTGRRTADNRDCAGLGVRGDEALCIVLDGSTRGPDSGALARDIARGLIDWFVELESAVTAGALKAKLRDLHQALASRRPRASARRSMRSAAWTSWSIARPSDWPVPSRIWTSLNSRP